jgi:hypothetical protein
MGTLIAAEDAARADTVLRANRMQRATHIQNTFF